MNSFKNETESQALSKKDAENFQYLKKNIMAREKAINGFKEIMKIKPQPGQEFCVIAYFILDKNYIEKNGSYGMLFIVGTYPRADMAIEKAEEMIRKTEINSIYAMKTCDFQEINDKYKPNRTKYVPINRDKILEDQHEKEYQEIKEELEKREKIEKDIEKEIEKEKDPTSLEYYTQEWYSTIINKSMIDQMKKKLQEEENQFQLKLKKIKDLDNKNPTHYSKMLPELKKTMIERNEENIYNKLEKEILLFRKEFK